MPVPLPDDQADAPVPRGIGTQQFRYFRPGGGVVSHTELPLSVTLSQYGIQSGAQKLRLGIPDRHEHSDFRPASLHMQTFRLPLHCRKTVFPQFQPHVVYGRRIIQRTDINARVGQSPQARPEHPVVETPGSPSPCARLFREPGQMFTKAEFLQPCGQIRIPGKSARQAGRQFAAKVQRPGAPLRRQQIQQMQQRGGFRRMSPTQPGRIRAAFFRFKSQIARTFLQPGRQAVFQSVVLNLGMIVPPQQIRLKTTTLHKAVPKTAFFPGVEAIAQHGPGRGLGGKNALTRGRKAQTEIQNRQPFQPRPETAHGQKVLPPHQQSRFMSQLKGAPPCSQGMAVGQALI